MTRREGEGLEGKKWPSKASLIWKGDSAPGRFGNLGSALRRANFLAVQIERRVASARKDFQLLALAALIALKYPPFDSLAVRASAGSLVDRALWEAEWNSFLRVDKRGDHHGFALVDSRHSGVCCFRREASMSKCLSNHTSKARRVGRVGGGGTELSLKRGSRVGQSVLDQLGLGGGGEKIGCEKRIMIGIWAEPVEGRGVSHDLKKGASDVDAKARSRTEGLPIPVGGNRV